MPLQPNTNDQWQRDVERRLHVLEGGARANRTSISEGSLDVINAADQVAVRLGLQTDGTYGLSVFDDLATEFKLGLFAFGITVHTAEPPGDVAFTSNTTPTAVVVPFNVTIGPSGRALLITSGLGTALAGSVGGAGWSTNVGWYGPTATTGPYLAVRQVVAGGASGSGPLLWSVCAVQLITGIEPGVNRVEWTGLRTSTLGTGETNKLQSGTIAVLPF